MSVLGKRDTHLRLNSAFYTHFQFHCLVTVLHFKYLDSVLFKLRTVYKSTFPMFTDLMQLRSMHFLAPSAQIVHGQFSCIGFHKMLLPLPVCNVGS